MPKSIFALSWTNGKPRAKARYSAKKNHSSLLFRLGLRHESGF
jgi:hypothetical protein